MKFNSIFSAVCLSLLFSGYGVAASPRLKVATVNYPLKFFTQTIAGTHAEVILPMPAEIDPAYWVPQANDISQLQQVDMILLNGAYYAKWLPKVSLPIFKLVNTSSDFRNAYIPLQESITHNHGSGGEHSHTGTAFTTWLDFNQAALQAKSVYKALSKKRPRYKSEFVKNFIPLQEALLSLDESLKQSGTALQGAALIGSHPVYQYLKRAYQLNLKSVHWEPESFPNDQQWQAFEQLLQNHPAKWMLWEAQPDAKTVEKLQSLGVHSIVFNPAANQPDSGDFLSIMQENVQRLKSINTPNPNQ